MKKKSGITAIYPGTFDPVTLGHIDIIKKASRLFDNVIVAVAPVAAKKTLFDTVERVEMISLSVVSLKNVGVKRFEGLLVDFAKSNSANLIIRGIRSVSDFDYENQMMQTNRVLEPSIETVFFIPSAGFSFISSTLVREISLNGGDISKFVNKIVADRIKKKIKSAV